MGMAAIQTGAARPLENKMVLIDPSGKVVFSYFKSRPAAPEAAIMVRGDGHLPVAATELGRIASAICFEADFPEFVRQIGRGHADLWIVPANDWEAIKRIHFEMAVFRAIENGSPMLRATSSGLSVAVDPWGAGARRHRPFFWNSNVGFSDTAWWRPHALLLYWRRIRMALHRRPDCWGVEGDSNRKMRDQNSREPLTLRAKTFGRR